MRIYHPYESTPIDLSVSDESYRYRELQGEDYVQLEFSCAEPIELPLMSYIYVDYVPYKLLDKPKITKVHSRNYEYVARFESPQSMLKLYRFRNTVDRRLSFPLTAKPHEHLEMLIAQLEVRDSMWRLGECIDAPAKTINYDYLTCYEALELMASIFETEWEVVDGAISLHKVEYDMDNPLALSYGKDKGLLPGVERANLGSEKPLLTICPQGGERNIDPSKYGSKTLRLPQLQSIKYDGRHFEDEPSYDDAKGVEYATDEDGTFVRRFIPTHNLAEGVLDCTEIYPHREGVVSVVIARDAAQNFYDIADKNIPDSLDYEDYRIVGEDMTIVFQTGMLAGKEFVVTHYAHNAVGNLPARRFEIEPREYDGMIMPGGDFKPAVGDKYAIFGTALPSAYIADNTTKSGAAWDMFRKCVKYLYDNEKPAYTFTGKLDPMFVKRHSLYDKLRVGAYISFSDANFQPEAMLMRVASVKDYINNPANIEVSIKEKAFAPTSHVRQLERSSRESTTIDTKVRSLGKSTDVTVLRSQLNTLIGGDHEMSAREIAEDVVSTSGGGGGGAAMNAPLEMIVNGAPSSYDGTVKKTYRFYAPKDAPTPEQIVYGTENSIAGWTNIKTVNGNSILGDGDIRNAKLSVYINGQLVQYDGTEDKNYRFFAPQLAPAAGQIVIGSDDNFAAWSTVKTINGESILGEGDIAIGGDLPIVTVDSNVGESTMLEADTILELTTPQTNGRTFIAQELELSTSATHEWGIRFSIGADNTGTYEVTSNLPLVWENGVAPLFQNGAYYEISLRSKNGTVYGEYSAYGDEQQNEDGVSDVYIADFTLADMTATAEKLIDFTSLRRAMMEGKVILVSSGFNSYMVATTKYMAGVGMNPSKIYITVTDGTTIYNSTAISNPASIKSSENTKLTIATTDYVDNKSSDVYVMDIKLSALSNDQDVTFDYASLESAINDGKIILIEDPLSPKMMFMVSASLQGDSILMKVSNTLAYIWAVAYSNGDGTGTIGTNNKMYKSYATEEYVTNVVGDINTLLETIIVG